MPTRKPPRPKIPRSSHPHRATPSIPKQHYIPVYAGNKLLNPLKGAALNSAIKAGEHRGMDMSPLKGPVQCNIAPTEKATVFNREPNSYIKPTERPTPVVPKIQESQPSTPRDINRAFQNASYKKRPQRDDPIIDFYANNRDQLEKEVQNLRSTLSLYQRAGGGDDKTLNHLGTNLTGMAGVLESIKQELPIPAEVVRETKVRTAESASLLSQYYRGQIDTPFIPHVGTFTHMLRLSDYNKDSLMASLTPSTAAVKGLPTLGTANLPQSVDTVMQNQPGMVPPDILKKRYKILGKAHGDIRQYLSDTQKVVSFYATHKVAGDTRRTEHLLAEKLDNALKVSNKIASGEATSDEVQSYLKQVGNVSASVAHFASQDGLTRPDKYGNRLSAYLRGESRFQHENIPDAKELAALKRSQKRVFHTGAFNKIRSRAERLLGRTQQDGEEDEERFGLMSRMYAHEFGGFEETEKVAKYGLLASLGGPAALLAAPLLDMVHPGRIAGRGLTLAKRGIMQVGSFGARGLSSAVKRLVGLREADSEGGESSRLRHLVGRGLSGIRKGVTGLGGLLGKFPGLPVFAHKNLDGGLGILSKLGGTVKNAFIQHEDANKETKGERSSISLLQHMRKTLVAILKVLKKPAKALKKKGKGILSILTKLTSPLRKLLTSLPRLLASVLGGIFGVKFWGKIKSLFQSATHKAKTLLKKAGQALKGAGERVKNLVKAGREGAENLVKGGWKGTKGIVKTLGKNAKTLIGRAEKRLPSIARRIGKKVLTRGLAGAEEGAAGAVAMAGAVLNAAYVHEKALSRKSYSRALHVLPGATGIPRSTIKKILALLPSSTPYPTTKKGLEAAMRNSRDTKAQETDQAINPKYSAINWYKHTKELGQLTQKYFGNNSTQIHSLYTPTGLAATAHRLHKEGLGSAWYNHPIVTPQGLPLTTPLRELSKKLLGLPSVNTSYAAAALQPATMGHSSSPTSSQAVNPSDIPMYVDNPRLMLMNLGFLLDH